MALAKKMRRAAREENDPKHGARHHVSPARPDRLAHMLAGEGLHGSRAVPPQQHRDDREEREGVDQENGSGAGRGKDDAADSRTDRTSKVLIDRAK